MRVIDLVSLRISGFKSYSREVLVDFTPGCGLRFMTGENLADVQLDSNGAGKSALFDAAFWCFYGTSARGSRTSTLLSAGMDRIVVEAVIEIDGDEYPIRREGPPDRLYVAGEREEQETVNDLLGLDGDRFLASVLFAQAMPTFYDLSVPERGDLLDGLLGLGLWLRISEFTAGRVRGLEAELATAEKQVAFADGVLSRYDPEILADLEQTRTTWQAAHEAEVRAAIGMVELAETNIGRAARAMEEADSAPEALFDEAALKQELSAVTGELAKVQVGIARTGDAITFVDGQLRFYASHDDCPTCGQALATGFIAEASDRLQGERVGLAELLAEFREREPRLKADAGGVQDKLLGVQSMRRTGEKLREVAQAEHARCRDRLAELTAAAERLVDETNPFESRVADFNSERDAAVQARQEADDACTALRARHDRLDYWVKGFRSVRLYQIGQVLAQLELQTNAEAGALGLAGWHIAYATETPTRTGGMRQGVQISVHAPDRVTAEYSPGELQRVRLAVAMGMAALVQRRAGVDYAFEVWDEPSNFLAAGGIGDLLECLENRAVQLRKKVWLIDHRLLSFGFREIWQAVKTADGTAVHLLTGDE